jgi:serine/tyrosine/threonine adenylyltransferase
MKSGVAPFPFDNSYQSLPEQFHARVLPTPVSAPRLIALNESLCQELGLSWKCLQEKGAEFFSGNEIPDGASPIAQAYAGHQFGNFVPQLGDGRAILLGEILTPGGIRRDIQLKGAGPTPFSRRGDGRAGMGPVLREYLVSEAMHALGIPTTRALAAVSTGDPVFREETLPGAVLTRAAASHIRVGTFEYFAARNDDTSVEELARHVIERHYPECRDAESPFQKLLESVAERQAALVARWMQVGFIHGVMNTDNMTVSGETIDYGPCAFMDAYHPQTVYSAIDRGGRYAFSNQPKILQWNLARFAETLLPFLGATPEGALEFANTVIDRIPSLFEERWTAGMRAKLGLSRALAEDTALIERLLRLMQDGEADYTLTFRQLCAAAEKTDGEAQVASLFKAPEELAPWMESWKGRLCMETASPEAQAAAMRLVNPAVIPRNHRVAQALAAAEHGDFAVFERLHEVLKRPYEIPEGAEEMVRPPEPHEKVLRTFCGT